MNRTLYCFIGESGSGKNAVVSAVTEQYGIPEIRSYTARLPRYEGETSYIFSNENTYKEHKENNLIFEETEIQNEDSQGNKKLFHYWTLNSEYDFVGKKMLICDKQGIEHVKEKLLDANIVVIHIKADAVTRLNRLIESSTKETMEEKIADSRKRLARSSEKFICIPCDWVIDNNGDLEDTIKYVKQIMKL